MQKRFLGEILLSLGYCSHKHILEAIHCQHDGDNRRIGEILVGIGAITDNQLQKALAVQKEATDQ